VPRRRVAAYVRDVKPLHRDTTDETRADIARRRLAQLVSSFDAELPPPDEPDPVMARPRTPLSFTQSASPGRAAPKDDPTGAAAPAKSPDLIVDVVGKVNTPGIVTLPKGWRVFEAIKAAGGLKGRVDTTSLNMARELNDGEQVLVGVAPVAAAGPVVGESAPGAGGDAPIGVKVNLNTATVEQLDTLPGVGPVTAQAILSWRETNGRFGTVDDLLDVKGIGEATLAELRDLVVV
jgi:competence protein ComEA